VDDIVLDGIEVTRGSQGIMIRNFATLGSTQPRNIVIRNSNVHTNGTTNPGDHGFYIGKCQGCIIESNKVHINATTGITIGDELTTGHVADIEVRYNHVYNNGRAISPWYRVRDGMGIHIYGAMRIRVYYNLLTDQPGTTGSGGGGIWIRQGPGGGATRTHWVYNNTIYNNGYGIYVDGLDSSSIVKNNIIYNNTHGTIRIDSGTISESHNLTTYPSFTNAAANDFTLQPGSAAIDAGTTTITGTITLTQFRGAAPDIGYWESGGSSQIVPSKPTKPTNLVIHQ
jgi:parallel beta-helix repeat protein